MNSQCPATADLTYFSAVYGNESLVVFGSAFESSLEEDGRSSYWFVDVNFAELDLKVNMKANGIDPFIEVHWEHEGEKRHKILYRNIIYSPHGIEWSCLWVNSVLAGFQIQ